MEEWKDVEGYEGLYQISTFGNIRAYKKWRKRDDKGRCTGYNYSQIEFQGMKINRDKKGYNMVLLSKNNIRKGYKIHRLVMLNFTTERNDGVDHIDNDKDNNRLDNLQWLSSGDNYRKNNSGDDHWTRRKKNMYPRTDGDNV